MLDCLKEIINMFGQSLSLFSFEIPFGDSSVRFSSILITLFILQLILLLLKVLFKQTSDNK